MSETPISPLRARMIEDMSVRKFGEKTQNDYIRHVKSFSTFLGRSPAKATGEDLRRYQVHQSKAGAQPPTINNAVAALRFFFRVTLSRPEMCRHLTMVRQSQKLPTVLSKEERQHPASSTRPPSAWPTAPVCASPRSPTSRFPTSTESAC
jgi:integrase/recombinase XerD